MTIIATREQRRAIERENAKRPAHFSRDFLVQEFASEHVGALCRLSVNRTTLGGNGRWLENITWDDLQQLKNEAGFAHHDAVEVFPAARDVVNVANMRHLWVLAEPLPFAWRRV